MAPREPGRGPRRSRRSPSSCYCLPRGHDEQSPARNTESEWWLERPKNGRLSCYACFRDAGGRRKVWTAGGKARAHRIVRSSQRWNDPDEGHVRIRPESTEKSAVRVLNGIS